MHTIRVTFANGDSLVTSISGTKEEILAYYQNNVFNIGQSEDNLQTVASVVFLEDKP